MNRTPSDLRGNPVGRNLVFIAVALWFARLGWAGQTAGECRFSPCAPHTLLGDASDLATDEIQLTPYGAWMAGAAWWPKAVDLDKDFDLRFEVDLGWDPHGGDGMALVIQGAGDQALGSSGSALGIEGGSRGGGRNAPAIIPSFALAFVPNAADGRLAEMELLENGQPLVQAGGKLPAGLASADGRYPEAALAQGKSPVDGLFHEVRLNWNSRRHEMKVFFDGASRLTFRQDLKRRVFQEANCLAAGFTASTSMAMNDQRIRLEGCPRATLTPTPEWTAGHCQASCAAGITVDGKLNEPAWGQATWQDVAKLATGRDPGEVAARFALLQDATNVYLAAKIQAKSPHSNRPNIWENDSVEAYLAMDNVRSNNYGAKDYHFIFGWNNPIAFDSGRKVAGLQFATLRTPEGWNLEAAIPWAGLGGHSQNVSTLGFDLAVDFNPDGTGRQGQLVWSGDSNDYAETSLFGYLDLASCAQ